MKLSEIIAKYEPLGWQFEYRVWSEDSYWTFKSPRMENGAAFAYGEHPFDVSKPELLETSEEKMLEREVESFIYQVYHDKLTKQFDAIKADILRQMVICDRKKVSIPKEMNISFDLKF